MDDLRKFEDLGAHEAAISASTAVAGNDDVLELVWEFEHPGSEAAAIIQSAPERRNDRASNSLAGWQRDELLLDHELDPAGEPRLDLSLPAKPYFLVSVPNSVELAGSSSAREQRSRRKTTDAPRAEATANTLAGLLVQARALAVAADAIEGRSRGALYDAIGRAYDVAVAAREEPNELARLLISANISAQPRAPAMAIVKLVFGSAYDKTRLSEYATALLHADRIGLDFGALAKFLRGAAGGLKGVVAEERNLRRLAAGATKPCRLVPRAGLVRKLRSMPLQPIDALPATGDEFALVLVRRLPNGSAALIGEIPHDISMLERAARRLADSRD